MLLAIGQSFPGLAQHSLPELMKHIREVNNSSKISYDYVVYLSDLNTGKQTDSIKGRLSKDGRQYVDSNDNTLTVSNGEYYCKIDFGKKVATVFNIPLIQKRLHLSLNEAPVALINIPDSILIREGHLKVDTTNRYAYRLNWTLPGNGVSGIWVEILKSDYTIRAVTMETDEQNPNDSKDHYRKTYTLYHIRYAAEPSDFNVDRIFSVAGNKITMASRYSGYKLKTLTN